MDFKNLPTKPQDIISLKWADLKPFASELEARPISSLNVEQWLRDWTALSPTASGEMYSRLSLATTVNTADEKADQMFKNFLDNVFPGSHELRAET